MRNFWRKAQETAVKAMPPHLTRAEYLSDIAPSSSSALLDPLADSAAGGADGGGGGPAGKPSAQSISKEAQEALQPAFRALFLDKKHHVCNMATIRHWLQVGRAARARPRLGQHSCCACCSGRCACSRAAAAGSRHPWRRRRLPSPARLPLPACLCPPPQDFPDAGPAKDAAQLTDKALHEAIMGTGLVTNIKMVYFWKAHGARGPRCSQLPAAARACAAALARQLRSPPAAGAPGRPRTAAPGRSSCCTTRHHHPPPAGDAKLDALRGSVVELLRERDYVRRNDVFDNAKALSIEITDSLYNRVIKELCSSNGNQWRLKTGAEM